MNDGIWSWESFRNTLKLILVNILKALPSLFSKNLCFSCQKEGSFFCPQCAENIQVYYPYCYWCKKPSEDFITHNHCRQSFPLSQVVVLSHYHSPHIPKLLKHAKYYKKQNIYGDIIFAKKDFFTEYIDSKSIFVPVPMHVLRKWKRGYNQSEIIAEKLSKICHISVNNSFIKRAKHTKQQSRLPQSKRLTNLEKAFKLCSTSLPKNTTIYLVDDIVSTWATLIEIAALLNKNWYNDVRAVCIASD